MLDIDNSIKDTIQADLNLKKMIIIKREQEQINI